MDIRRAAEGNVLVMALAGEFDSVETEGFSTAIEESIGDGHTRVIIDLGAVEFMDSSAIKCLLKAERDLKDRGGGMCVARPHDMVAKVLERLQISHVIPVCEDLEGARAVLEGGEA
ncbi:MAG: STAS domain-containing protein [Planctomycetota bacterium]|jgi:anti-anti-sigma factor